VTVLRTQAKAVTASRIRDHRPHHNTREKSAVSKHRISRSTGKKTFLPDRFFRRVEDSARKLQICFWSDITSHIVACINQKSFTSAKGLERSNEYKWLLCAVNKSCDLKKQAKDRGE
jgi:hypothetical protein